MAMRFKNPLCVESDNIRKKDPYEGMPPLDCNFNINNKKTDAANANIESYDPNCNCCRPLSAIFCTKCGHIFTGRMRTVCPSHPKVIHLMDCTNCPSCHSIAVKEYGTD